MRLLVWLIVALVAATACSSLSAPPFPSDEFNSGQAIRQGGLLFADHCASCHGDAGTGGFVPDAIEIDNDGRFVREVELATTPLTDAFERVGEEGVLLAITQGRSDTFMPAYGVDAGGNFTDSQIAKTMAYLRSEQE